MKIPLKRWRQGLGMGMFLALMAVALITAVIVFVLFGLTAAKKIHMGGRVSAYILFTVLPFLIYGNYNFFIMIAIKPDLKWYLLIPMIIFDFNILILSTFLLIKINIFPIATASDTNVSGNRLLSGKRLLQYSIYTNILYMIPACSFILFLGVKDPTIAKMMAAILCPIMLLIPPYSVVTAFLYSILFFWFVLLGIAFVLSINGTIRVLIASNRIRKFAVIYVLLMFVPLANIICMFILCRLVKK